MAAALGSRLWINGAIAQASETTVPLTDRGFTLGDGIFETMLWTGTRLRFFSDHMARLSHAAAELGFVLPATAGEIETGLNTMAYDANGARAVVRLTLTRGSGPRGLALPYPAAPSLMATLAPFANNSAAANLQTVSVTRHAGAPSARFKTLSYIDNIIALKQATQAGGDDAIMLGTTGYVACASSANLILRYKDTALTPALEDGALPGIVRGRLIRTGIVQEARISQAQLGLCNTAVMTNAIIGVREVGQIDGRSCTSEPDWTRSLLEVLTDTD